MSFAASPSIAGATCMLRHEVQPSDREAVRDIVERTGFFRADEVDVAVELVETRLSQGPESGYEFVLADLGLTLAGYACFGSIPCTIGSFDLYWIAVDPRRQRSGIGRALILGAQERIAAMGGRRLYIDTSGRDLYASTRAFYERAGFHCEARLADFYAPNDDRMVYVKAL